MFASHGFSLFQVLLTERAPAGSKIVTYVWAALEPTSQALWQGWPPARLPPKREGQPIGLSTTRPGRQHSFAPLSYSAGMPFMNGVLLTMRLLPLLVLVCVQCWGETTQVLGRDAPPFTVGYLRAAPATTEQRDALQWLRKNDHFRVRPIDLGAQASVSGETDVLWLHLPDSSAYAQWKGRQSQAAQRLRAYYENGGRLLLTNYAARLPHAMGIEPKAPEKEGVEVAPDVALAELVEKPELECHDQEDQYGSCNRQPVKAHATSRLDETICALQQVGNTESQND